MAGAAWDALRAPDARADRPRRRRRHHRLGSAGDDAAEGRRAARAPVDRARLADARARGRPRLRRGDRGSAEARGDSLDDAQRASLREARRDRDRAVKVPAELVRELAMAEAEGFEVWQRARPANDFASFRPVLERLVALKQQEADAIGHDGERYDALLDALRARHAPRAPRAAAARAARRPRAAGRRDRREAACPTPRSSRATSPRTMQIEFSERVIRDLGFDMEAGRQDESAHPFTSGSGPYDVRLTTRIVAGDPRGSLMGTIHETGHGLYEQGIVGASDRAHLRGHGAVARPARVAVAPLGEPGRSLARLLGALLPGLPRGVPRCARRRRARRSGCARSTSCSHR